MKRNFCFKLIFIIFIFFLCITVVSAKECTTEELRELKQLAKKVDFSYELSELTDGYDNLFFTMTGYNLNNKMYLYIPISGNEVYYTKPSEKIGVFSLDSELKIVIYASSKTNCEDEKLNSISIELPVYNKYFNRKECDKNKSVNVCKKWYDTTDITEEGFLQIIKSINPVQKNNLLNNVKIFFESYGIYLIGVFVITTITIVVIKIVKDKKRTKIEI